MSTVTKLIIGCALCFIGGFIAFSWQSFELVPAPAAWQVAGAERSLTNAFHDCFSGNDNNRTAFMICAQKKLIIAVKRWGVRALMVALGHRLDSHSIDITECHDLAHAVGWAGIVETQSLSKVMESCNNTCVYGCGHGAMSAWYALGHDVVGHLGTMCIEGIDWSKNPQGINGCFHELGHALTSIANYDINRSLALCDKVDPSGRMDCASGVFMETFEAATFATVRQPLPSNHPYWCASLEPAYQEFCWDQAGANEYGYYQDEEGSIAVCRKVPAQYQAGCILALGQNMFYVYQYDMHHMQRTIDFCRKTGEFFPACISGALSSAAAVEPAVYDGVTLCTSLMGEDRAMCVNELAGILQAHRTRVEIAAICHTLPAPDQQACIGR